MTPAQQSALEAVAVVNDCAVTTLRLNLLQAEIGAQPIYRSGHSK